MGWLVAVSGHRVHRHDLKEGNTLFVYYYTYKMLVPLQVLQRSLHKELKIWDYFGH